MGYFINSELLLMLYSNLKTLTMKKLMTRTSHAINTLLYYCIIVLMLQMAHNVTISNKYVYCTIQHGRA